MLNIKLFGTGPAPAWTQDQASFQSWASCRIGRPAFSPKVPRKFPAADKAAEVLKKAIKVWDAQPCPEHLVAWEIKEESSFSFGWGAVRFSITQEQSGQLRLDTDTWVIKGWRPIGPGHQKAMSLLLDLVSGRLGPPASIDANRFDLFWSNHAPYAVAPWSADDVVEVGSAPLFCRLDENSDVHLFEIQAHYGDPGELLRWIGHRLRYAARRWPALRWIWAAARADESKNVFPVGPALQALHRDPRWLRQSLDWLVFCQTDLLHRPTLDWESFRFREYDTYEVEAIPDIFEKAVNIGDALCMGWARPGVRRWSDALPMAQALRLFRAVQSQEKSNTGRGGIQQKSPSFMVVDALASARLPVPSMLRLAHMFKNPLLFMAWLLELPDWCSSPGPWPYAHFILEHEKCPQVKYWREMLSTLKKEYEENPVAFRALARAGQAWLITPIKRKAMTVPETLAADEEVFSQLQSPALSAFLEWDRLGFKAPWSSYVRLLRIARARAMDINAQAEQTGVVPESAAEQNKDDASWLSALGGDQCGQGQGDTLVSSKPSQQCG